MKTHHRIALIVREEPEGHGTLFVRVGKGPRRAPHREALALIHRTDMESDRISTNFVDALRNVLSEKIGDIAEALAAADIESGTDLFSEIPLEHPCRSKAVQDETLAQFLAWMENTRFTIGDFTGGIVNQQDLLDMYSERAEGEFFTFREVLECFARWLDNHSRWELSDTSVTPSRAKRARDALKEYLEEVDKHKGEWIVQGAI